MSTQSKHWEKPLPAWGVFPSLYYIMKEHGLRPEDLAVPNFVTVDTVKTAMTASIPIRLITFKRIASTVADLTGQCVPDTAFQQFDNSNNESETAIENLRLYAKK